MKTIKISLPEPDLHLIERAATLADKSCEEFIADAAVHAAHDIICDQTDIRVDSRTFAGFVAELDRAPQDNLRLRAAFQRKAPWES